MNCKVDKMYPNVQVEGPNLYYANLLLEDYAGVNGELTAITQYVFQKFDKFQNREFKSILSEIAVVEMKHLELLGETIKLLGLTPQYKFRHNNYYEIWNANFVNYSSDLVSMLKDDILKEELAINNYEKHIALINDKYIKEMLQRIIEDEQQHIKCFNYLLNKVITKY